VSTAQSLERLFSLHPKLIDLSLGRIERLLAALDHPEQQLPPVIHIAGTNGKGSTTAFLRALAGAQGLAVQAYTSPHLVRFHERIRLSSGLITEPALQAILDDIEAINAEQAITFFEVTTVAAFQAFARDQADLCLLEVGLGGKFDATNVIGLPAACIITPVAMDHENFLGDELSGIAEEKAGILKPGVPAFAARQDPVALEVITRRAAEIGVPLFLPGKDWTVTRQDNAFVYKDRLGSLNLPVPALQGDHQIDNAALAMACLRHLELLVEDNKVATAMDNVQWPARLQPIESGPLFDLCVGKGSLTLDGGHNVHAATAIAGHLAGSRVHLVLGMLENREIAPVLEALKPIVTSVAAVPIIGEASHSASAIETCARQLDIEARSYETVEQALEAFPDGDRLVFGSLYLAGQVLEKSGLTPS
jgi:dihydrofolate synthase/folylpolyglutamate synthase